MEIVLVQVICKKKKNSTSFIEQAYFISCAVYGALVCAMEDTVVTEVLVYALLSKRSEV
jgi:hypothetical protein